MENSGQRNARKNHGQTASPQTQSHPHFRGWLQSSTERDIWMTATQELWETRRTRGHARRIPKRKVDNQNTTTQRVDQWLQ
jgi:hypothetical protein